MKHVIIEIKNETQGLRYLSLEKENEMRAFLFPNPISYAKLRILIILN